MTNETTIVPNIYLPAPKYIPRPSASMSLYASPNDIHQADILYLPHDRYEKKVYKCTLNIVDVASRYKASHQLVTKNSKEVAQAFQWIYKNTELNFPKTLDIFMNLVNWRDSNMEVKEGKDLLTLYGR